MGEHAQCPKAADDTHLQVSRKCSGLKGEAQRPSQFLFVSREPKRAFSLLATLHFSQVNNIL